MMASGFGSLLLSEALDAVDREPITDIKSAKLRRAVAAVEEMLALHGPDTTATVPITSDKFELKLERFDRAHSQFALIIAGTHRRIDYAARAFFLVRSVRLVRLVILCLSRPDL